VDTLRKQLIDLVSYKDGDYYLGGIATSKAMSIMGKDYGHDGWEASVLAASNNEIRKVAEYLKHYLDHMKKRPMKQCPCCKRYYC